MSFAGASRAERVLPFATLQDLYDHHRFLDAFQLTSELWNPSTDVEQFTVDELILAGRLAARLGGRRLYRWLLRKAVARQPSTPRVRYFGRHVPTPRARLLDELKGFEAQPDLGGDDLPLRAWWYASFAFTWGMLRDFERAQQCLDRAHSLAPNDSWVLSCESDVHGQADRWLDALRSAERAWELDPGAPFAAASLGASLLNLGRVQEAAERLHAAAEGCQSFDIVLYAAWYQCALAETVEGQQRRAILEERARPLADRLTAVAPLADRDARAAIARTYLDIADLADDYAGIERWTNEVRSPFHRQLLANLKKNPEGRRIRLTPRRNVQKHEACVPTSIEVAMSASGLVVSADQMSSEITFGGTPEWAAAEWLQKRGFHVRFFAVTAELAAQLILKGIAFVLSWDADENGHAVAIVGLDQRSGTLLVHDPMGFRDTEYLLNILERNASPLGIKGMAVVAPERAALLDSLLPAESMVMEAAQQHQQALITQGPSAARRVVEDLLQRYPLHPGSLYLQAAQQLEDGQAGLALKQLQTLLQRFPRSPAVRVRFMAACRALGNTALIRETLEGIVERSVLPGLEAQRDWVHPPDRYVFEYADLLRLSADTRDHAEALLHALIRRQCNSAGAWHNLADLLWQRREMEGALLCYRLSSCLAPSDEHYARAYADVLGMEKRDEEGFAWLQSRVRRFGDSPHAVSTWISWINALEDRGFPERALAACNEALARHGGSPELLAFAVAFFARMGEWENAEDRLSAIDSKDNPAAFYEASTHFFRMRGDLKRALENAASWLGESPCSPAARYSMLDLVASSDGPEAAVATAARWMRDNRHHEGFEEAYCAQLDRASAPKWRKYSVLLRRLKRNPEDGWAWRELTFDCLYQYSMLPDVPSRGRVAGRLEQFLSECNRTSAGDAATIRAHALWSEYRNQWPEAVATSLRAVERDPGNMYSYERIWECSSRLSGDERRQLWAQIEPVLLRAPGRFSVARHIMRLLVDRFGVTEAEKTVASWRAARPDDPDIIEAAADLLIDHGHGRSDAQRAIALLQPAVERYPYHSGLRFSLGSAYRRAGQHAEADNALSEVIRRHPDNTYAKIRLAWVRFHQDDAAGAYELLDSAQACSPRNSDILEARVQMLMDAQRFAEASDVIQQALERMPEDVPARNRAITLFMQCGAPDKAMQAARAGIEVYPRGAYLWLLLGRTLNDMRQYAEMGEIEACLRKSLRLNVGLFEAADLLSLVLAEQRRYDDASAVMREIASAMGDPSPALGRLAWLKRAQGSKREALADLSEVLTASPWYSWGWNVLMDWLEEDQAWEQACRLLREIPPQMLTHTSFRYRRLLLLEKAGLERDRLDEEWRDLLRDFPEDLSLHVRRYDSLSESKRFDEAAAVLASILQVEPDSSFTLARHVEVLARQQKKEAALEQALRVCFAPVEESTWPADKVWDVARDAGFAEDLYASCRQRVLAAEKPSRRSFAKMASYAMRNEPKRFPQPKHRIWFPGGWVHELVLLARAVTKTPWDGSDYRAELYSVLSDYGYHQLVRKLWKKFGSAVQLGVDEWSQVGRALAAGRDSEGRRFLAAWRERPGVEMWLIANYVNCLSRLRRAQLGELFTSCRDALQRLPHDHCASYLAHRMAEASALLGDDKSFLEVWAAYPNYFKAPLREGEYFHPKKGFLRDDIPRLAEYLEQGRRRRYRLLVWGLRWKEFTEES